MIKRTTLDNGANVIAVKMPQAKSVAIHFGFRTGSRSETRDISGISHFLEHMVFKGSEKRKTNREIAGAIDAIGARYNASTSQEYTTYYIKTTEENFDLALDVIGDMVTKPLLNKKEVEIERHSILQELNMYSDNPDFSILDQVESSLFGDTPMGWFIGGYPDSVKKISQENILDYYKSYYTGANCTAVIAGNLPKDYLKKITIYLERFKKGKRNKWKQATFNKNHIKILPKKTKQAHLGIMIPAYSLFDGKRYALKLISTILGGYMSSRLFAEIRDKRGWAYSIGSFTDSATDCGRLGITGGIKANKIEEAIKVIKNQILSLTSTVTDEEIERAKGYIKGAVGLKFEDPDALAGFILPRNLLKGKVETPEEMIRKIEGVSKKEIVQVSKDLFKKENLYLALIGSFKNKEKFAKILKS